MIKVLSIFGTRPEAIKMAPVVKELEKHPDLFRSRTCVTAQHREMLDKVLRLFSIAPDHDLNIMKPEQDLFDVTSSVLTGLKEVIQIEQPDLLLVHGDTTTTMAATLGGFYCHIKVGHVEAGLRTWNKEAPFPEEINRRITGCVADMHFAPTIKAKQNLLREGISEESVWITGNTVIDALFMALDKLQNDASLQSQISESFDFLNPRKRLILATGHRRENFGDGFRNICEALKEVVVKNPETEIVYPVHLNPRVQEPVRGILGKLKNVHLIEPVDYLSFIWLMHRAYLVITDSGGVQEEAPSLGKPVLVMRQTTERPEAVEAGTARIVGTDRALIVKEVSLLLEGGDTYRRMTHAHNPYGDGHAAEKVTGAIRTQFLD